MALAANEGLGLGLTVGLASLALNYIRNRAAQPLVLTPPVLPKRPRMVPFGKVPGQNRGDQPMEPIIYLEDPYFYVRDDKRKNEEVLDHLRAENAYTKAALAHLEKSQDALYKELLSHVQETDQKVPYPHGDFLYYSRTEAGKAYAIHCRKPRSSASSDQDETVLLNVNTLADGQSHCNVGSVEISPDHKLLAYSVDFTAYETYDIYVKNVATNAITKEIERCNGSITWGLDASTIYYVTQDAAHRSYKVWSHKLGTPQSDDVCWFTEDNEMFSAGVYKTSSDRYVIISSHSKESSEARALDLTKPELGFVLIAPRAPKVKYSVNHWHDNFLITTNRDGDVNFKLMAVSTEAVFSQKNDQVAAWIPVFPYDPQVKVGYVRTFRSFFVLSGRQDGLTQLWIGSKDKSGKWQKQLLKMNDAMYSISGATNAEFDTDVFRFTYSSLTTPLQTLEYNTKTEKTECLKETPVPNYDRTLYHSERVEAKAADGTTIPMSMVYRKDLKRSEPQPLHLYGYGSYEIPIDPDFRSTILPLLDRGVIYVIAHIRGGGENGRTWYESAKYLTKINTFTDFIACAEHLIEAKYTTPKQMSCEGRSAGGLLMGAVLNLRPDLFTAAIAGVPFVDVMNTMSDATIPLTTGEWTEWGNPNEMKYFAYILQYSPYENVKAQDYPSMLVTGGLFDPRVPYWEPTKWVARSRERKTDSNQILLKMDMEAGHFSASDRYYFLKEKAIEISFLLDKLHLIQ
ncbi:unnamed protein product [Aphanomyces euteiches]